MRSFPATACEQWYRTTIPAVYKKFRAGLDGLEARGIVDEPLLRAEGRTAASYIAVQK